jgi:NADPH-dependent ferric siderophore reductase
MSLIENIAKLFTSSATVIYKEKISESAFHLKICGDDLKSLDYIPGQHLRILVGLGKSTTLKDKVRTYSVWNYDRKNQTIDMAVCTHSNGIGSKWIRELKIDDKIYFSKPKGNFIIDNTGDFYIFIGDISALGHLYEIRRNLPADKKVYSLIYSDKTEDFFEDLENKAKFSFKKLNQNPSEQISKDITELATTTNGKGIVYIGGDGRVCVELNKYFRQVLKWNTKQIKTKPFWHPDKIGLE